MSRAHKACGARQVLYGMCGYSSTSLLWGTDANCNTSLRFHVRLTRQHFQTLTGTGFIADNRYAPMAPTGTRPWTMISRVRVRRPLANLSLHPFTRTPSLCSPHIVGPRACSDSHRSQQQLHRARLVFHRQRRGTHFWDVKTLGNIKYIRHTCCQ